MKKKKKSKITEISMVKKKITEEREKNITKIKIGSVKNKKKKKNASDATCGDENREEEKNRKQTWEDSSSG